MQKVYSEDEIQILANSAIGKTFKELKEMKLDSFSDKEYNEKESNKAYFGHLLETKIYEYDINSYSEPDFVSAGIELKVTPYKINKDKSLSAKERLVLNIINYMTEYKNDFYSSHFWYKNKKIQIIWYLYEKNKKKEDLKITNQLLFTFPEEDLIIIKDDYNKIIEKIKKGKAHELSEADTMYLGACTKGVNKSSLRKQPFSDILAKQRAFCLKTSYMTSLVRKNIGKNICDEKILKNNGITFDNFINNVVAKYKGMSQQDLIKKFNISSNAKNLNYIIISRMFDVKTNLSNTDEFKKANIIPRTVRIKENGKIKESMPFPYFKYTEIANQNFEESYLKEILETTKYMFFIFKKQGNDYIFNGIKLWNMPKNIIDTEIKRVWNKTKDVILSGNIVKEVLPNGKRKTNFPGIKDSYVCHVRPHAIDSNDTLVLPVMDKITKKEKYTKQCFWLNNNFLEKILNDFNN